MRHETFGFAVETARPIGARRFLASPQLVPGVALVLHALVLILAAAIASAASSSPFAGPLEVQSLGLAVAAALFLNGRLGVFRMHSILTPRSRAIPGLLLAGGVLLAPAPILGLVPPFELALAFVVAGSLLSLAVGRAFSSVLWALHRRDVVGRSYVVLGTARDCRAVIRAIRRDGPSLDHLAGVFTFDTGQVGTDIEGHPVLGDVSALEQAIRLGSVEAVVVSEPWHCDITIAWALERLSEMPVDIRLWVGAGASPGGVAARGPRPVGWLARRPMTGWGGCMKRALDIALSLILIGLSAPLMALIALAVRLESPGPVLFRQARLGFNNQAFTILKFRTMTHAPGRPVDQASRNDPRCTRFGRLLRRTSLDELPQLFNVLGGSMSLVGPRPHALDHNADYGGRIRGYFARHRVRPGITGWAQVHGLRGETPELAMMHARVCHDIDYVENWSLLLDLRILIRTALVVLFQQRAY